MLRTNKGPVETAVEDASAAEGAQTVAEAQSVMTGDANRSPTERERESFGTAKLSVDGLVVVHETTTELLSYRGRGQEGDMKR